MLIMTVDSKETAKEKLVILSCPCFCPVEIHFQEVPNWEAIPMTNLKSVSLGYNFLPIYLFPHIS